MKDDPELPSTLLTLKAASWLPATAMLGVLLAACAKSGTSPTPSPPPAAPASAALTVTFGENPVPFRSTGCNASTPQGWFTTARIQETAGVTFTPSTFTQKLDGSAANFLAESFNSRFGACSGSSFTEGVIPANGAVCGVVGVCTSNTFATYQFELTGTDANGHALTFQSPSLQLGSR
jgi:hypothetical protein